MKKLKLEFSSHTGNLALMRQAVRRFLNDFGFSDQERLMMVLGVDEACTNIIRHAYELRDDQMIALSMEASRTCVRMRLRDYGRRIVQRSMKGRHHEVIRAGGLGLHLIRSAFDRVDYVSKRRGTELVLTKNID